MNPRKRTRAQRRRRDRRSDETWVSRRAEWRRKANELARIFGVIDMGSP